jgi:hypothetical protein
MSIWTIIPTCPDPMSQYTLAAIAIVVSCAVVVVAVGKSWASDKFCGIGDTIDKLGKSIDDHDDYITDTNAVINKMQIDLAVQQGALKSIEGDITEIKVLIASINTILLDDRRRD